MTAASYRLPTVITALTISGVLVGTHHTERLYPILPGGVALGLVILLTFQYRQQDWSLSYLGGYIALSSFYRIFAYWFPPSFIAADSDWYAFQISRLLTGSAPSSIPSRFYNDAPGFFFTGQISAVISGEPVKTGLIFPAVVVGITFPLVAFLLPRYLPIAEPELVQHVAPAITVMAPASVALTSAPIAQTQSVVITLTVVIALAIYVQWRSSALLVIAAFCFSIVLLVHKLAPYIVTAAVLFSVGVGLLNYQNRANTLDRTFGLFGLALGAGLYLQAVITNVDYGVIGRLLLLYGAGTEETTVSEFGTMMAEPILKSNALTVLFNVGYYIPLFALAAFGWLFLLWRGYNKAFVRFVLSIVALEVGLVIGATLGIISGGPFRYLFLVIPLLGILCAIVVVRLFTGPSLLEPPISIHRTIRIGVGFLLVTSLIGGQTVSLTASTDARFEQRAYLTTSELTGKVWMNSYVSKPIFTDNFYAREMPPSELSQYASYGNRPPTHYRGTNQWIINGTLADNADCFVALRIDVRRYGYQRGWRLTQPVTTGFRLYHTVYTSGSDGVSVFRKQRCSNKNRISLAT